MTLCDRPESSEKGLSSTIAWKFDQIQYAYEGNITVTGSGLTWALALTGSRDLESAVKRATELDSNGNVYFVPALAGLGAPHWDEKARGAVVGLSFDTGNDYVVRAALEAIAFQIKDVFDAMQRASARLDTLLADGGASKNDWLMQFQADILDRQVQRSQTVELSGLGAAFAAGLGCGFWSSTAEITKVVASHDTFRPVLEQDKRNQLVKRWNAAVSAVKTYGLAQ
jgi:glycerol kinase